MAEGEVGQGTGGAGGSTGKKSESSVVNGVKDMDIKVRWVKVLLVISLLYYVLALWC